MTSDENDVWYLKIAHYNENIISSNDNRHFD